MKGFIWNGESGPFGGKWYLGYELKDGRYVAIGLIQRKDWYWGRYDTYYDGPHNSFGFWFFNISWSW